MQPYVTSSSSDASLVVHPSAIMAKVSSNYDGYSIHALTTTKINELVGSFEEHMKWLEEVLIEAKNTFVRYGECAWLVGGLV